MRSLRQLALTFLVLFILPAAISTAIWAAQERPASWREANWQSSGLLPSAADDPSAVIHVMAARTGGLKGALSVHSWIVVKRAGAVRYDRYEKVGWGTPVRRNAYAADARWYSNPPVIVKSVRGPAAERLIPAVEAAIASYPFDRRGQYRLWPGPNSNTFVAHVLRAVPQIGAVLPPTAVGRDFPTDGGLLSLDADSRDMRATLYGLAGFSAGVRSGLELHAFGLVAGIDPLRPALKVPGFGRVGW